MASLDREALLAFLKDRAGSRAATTTAGLVIASIYDGLVSRIMGGEFDQHTTEGEDSGAS